MQTLPPFDFDAPRDRGNTDSMKWDRYKGRDIIPLWLADMDFSSPPAVIRAICERAEHGVFGYTLPPATLLETLTRRLADRYDWQIEPRWLIWLPGLVSGLNIACRAVGEKGDDVLTSVPIYPPFLSAPRLSNRNCLQVPLLMETTDEGQRWRMDFDLLEQTITPRTRLLLFCNPHNPTGRIFNRSEVERLVAICEKHDIIICSDEIHCELLLDIDKRHLPTASLGPEAAARTITLMAPSKTFNLPGLGCSFAIIADDRLRRRFRQTMADIVPYVNLFGYTAALAAYRDSHSWHMGLLDYLRQNRSIVNRAVNGMNGIFINHVEATYLAWLDTRETGIEEPALFFEQAGVGLADGRDFAGPGFLRFNFACPQSLLKEALTRMNTGLQQRR